MSLPRWGKVPRDEADEVCCWRSKRFSRRRKSERYIAPFYIFASLAVHLIHHFMVPLCLAAARAPLGSNSPPDCYSIPRGRFATHWGRLKNSRSLFYKFALRAKRTLETTVRKIFQTKKAENVRSLLFVLCQQGKSVFVDFKGLGLT